ncbi:EF-hand domain-containing protein [Glycomyces luteolus]|uniref:EF-hand domain-containing protein n=1 Tax=Glycomyces luteolus TaxID=2670330 RepID=A0A9X3P920_9ACTN|nr:EF-hand domain-containing protein [Glycomyces luteolus]MDA1361041.1 EF-hand domain-containing protein [Glycomyces luteolus]
MKKKTKAKALAVGAAAAATAVAAGAAILIGSRYRHTAAVGRVRLNKFDRWFDTLDTDGNGYITEANLNQAAARVLGARGVPVESPMGFELREATERLWAEFIAPKAGYQGRVGRRELRAALAEHMLSDQFAAAAKLASIADAYFAIADEDGDGLISSGEFVQLLRNWHGVDYQESHRVFEYLDADHDNRISPDEWRSAIFSFFLGSRRNHPANDLLGKVGSPILAPAEV